MVRQGSGAIVNCSSVGGFRGNPGIASYIASKHGVIGLTRTTALEYVAQGIRVNAVCPGAIDTQIARDVVGGNEEAYEAMGKGIPLGRIGRPERSRRPCCGCVARARASWSATPWSSTAAARRRAGRRQPCPPVPAPGAAITPSGRRCAVTPRPGTCAAAGDTPCTERCSTARAMCAAMSRHEPGQQLARAFGAHLFVCTTSHDMNRTEQPCTSEHSVTT